ncbi:MAG: glycosyltransferase family 4 protein [Anaerolineae bacterium]|nr:glycosyltransferase family 4 protein [Anaerolineae bacterium]
MSFLFDARVIQDHFPGIGRVAYHLLAHLPAMLEANERIWALRNLAAKNTRYDLAGLAHPNLRWLDLDTSVFTPRNILASMRLPNAEQAKLSHFNYYVRPLRAPRPSITSIYDAISFVYPQYIASFKTRLMIGLAHRLAVAASDAVITISHSAADDLMRFFPALKGRIFVTPLAADDRYCPQPDAEQTRVRAKFNLPPAFALYLASNKPHKNLARLVEAWYLLRTKNQEARIKRQRSSAETIDSVSNEPYLVIAGHQDPRFPQAKLLAEQLGIAHNVQFIGDVPSADMAALYSACDLFVFPSLYEGFGLTPLEAMACGAAVACANTSSLPEVVGEAALLFDPTQPHDIAAACHRILSDENLRQSLKARGLAQAKRFTWASTAKQTLEIYRAVSALRHG